MSEPGFINTRIGQQTCHAIIDIANSLRDISRHLENLVKAQLGADGSRDNVVLPSFLKPNAPGVTHEP